MRWLWFIGEAKKSWLLAVVMFSFCIRLQPDRYFGFKEVTYSATAITVLGTGIGIGLAIWLDGWRDFLSALSRHNDC